MSFVRVSVARSWDVTLLPHPRTFSLLDLAMLEMVKDDLETIHALAPLISAVVGGMGAFAAILNFKNRVLAFLDSRRKTKLSRVMSQWWIRVYDSLVASHDETGTEWGESEFGELTVLEACAWTDYPLPKWAVNGVEKKRLKEFTRVERS